MVPIYEHVLYDSCFFLSLPIKRENLEEIFRDFIVGRPSTIFLSTVPNN